MRALYEIQHAERSARAFETFMAVTGVGAERETDRSSALPSTPLTAINSENVYTRTWLCILYFV